MLKHMWETSPTGCILFGICGAFSAMTYFADIRFGAVQTIVTLIAFLMLFARHRSLIGKFDREMRYISSVLNENDKESLAHFPFPVIVTKDNGKIVWFNDIFKNHIVGEQLISDKFIWQFFPTKEISNVKDGETFTSEYGNRFYFVFVSLTENNGEKYIVFYFFDDTSQHNMVVKYAKTQPCIMVILVDNVNEVIGNKKESDKVELTGAIEKQLERYLSPTNGFVKRLGTSRFFAICEQQDLDRLIEDKFSILDEIRRTEYSGITGVTLSIGIGRGARLAEAEEMARSALDMALGRGGDQAAIKNNDKFEFFGGTTNSMEKRTKVKTRVVAAALFDLLSGCDSVYIMGHRFSDFDALGAAVGLYGYISKSGKYVRIVMSREKTLADRLCDIIEDGGLSGAIIEPGHALNEITERSALIIVDTHRKSFVEEPQLLEKTKNIVVIDHHRRTVDYIGDAVIFYHEPSSSSTSEMVTELLQYTKTPVVIEKPVAESLLAGIMLDTKNFVLRTGVRTFEAAAYLRARGADTVKVKRLFSDSIENYRSKLGIVAGAEFYKNCAVCVVGTLSDDVQLIAAQAADDLLSISGVEASFVIYPQNETVNISARSLGGINVQLLMEALGGGGNLTMAAAQIKNTSLSDAKLMLLSAIDSKNKKS